MIIDAASLMAHKAALRYNQDNTPWINLIWFDLTNDFWEKMTLRACEIVADVFAGMGVMKELPIEGYIIQTYT